MVSNRSATSGPSRVLVVEDDAHLSRMIAQALGADYAVMTAADGVQGLEQARCQPPDLVLSDLHMPRMSGLELLRVIRREPVLVDVPFIILTGLADEDLRVTALGDGASDYLTKPCSLAEIRLRVANHVSAKRARDVLRNELASTSRNLEELARELAESRREVQETLHVREQFLLEITHELRTPATNILGSAQLLMRDMNRPTASSSARAKQLAVIMEHQARRLGRLLDQALDLSQIDSGALRLQREETDLITLVQTTAADVLESARADHCLVMSATAPVRANVDRRRVGQVMMNLLENAVTYSPSGTSIEVSAESVGGEIAQISVRDHGPGIPAERRGELFSRFFQVNSGQHVAGRVGLGIGLHVCQRIVEQHGGRILADFPPDGGSRFVVQLPIA